jgi:hypothetical protein
MGAAGKVETEELKLLPWLPDPADPINFKIYWFPLITPFGNILSLLDVKLWF